MKQHELEVVALLCGQELLVGVVVRRSRRARMPPRDAPRTAPHDAPRTAPRHAPRTALHDAPRTAPRDALHHATAGCRWAAAASLGCACPPRLGR